MGQVTRLTAAQQRGLCRLPQCGSSPRRWRRADGRGPFRGDRTGVARQALLAIRALRSRAGVCGLLYGARCLSDTHDHDSRAQLVRGRARYGKRVVGCTASAAGAIFVCAVSPALWLRLTAIGVASFASGLGELTYLQLSTLYAGPADRRGRAIGWFSSGTGVRLRPKRSN